MGKTTRRKKKTDKATDGLKTTDQDSPSLGMDLKRKSDSDDDADASTQKNSKKKYKPFPSHPEESDPRWRNYMQSWEDWVRAVLDILMGPVSVGLMKCAVRTAGSPLVFLPRIAYAMGEASEQDLRTKMEIAWNIFTEEEKKNLQVIGSTAIRGMKNNKLREAMHKAIGRDTGVGSDFMRWFFKVKDLREELPVDNNEVDNKNMDNNDVDNKEELSDPKKTMIFRGPGSKETAEVKREDGSSPQKDGEEVVVKAKGNEAGEDSEKNVTKKDETKSKENETETDENKKKRAELTSKA